MKTCCILFLSILFSFQLIAQKQFNTLVFTKTHGYRHTSILEGVEALKKLGEKHYFDVEWTENANVFQSKKLKTFDVVIFLNTDGEILNNKQQEAFQDYIQKGNGFVGIHGAAASEQSWDWYGKLVGRLFYIHPKIQTGVLHIRNHDFPATYHLPEKWVWTDEWYQFGKELSDSLNYLITVDESTYNPKVEWEEKEGAGMGDFHPIAWYHEFDGGRSFYTGLGHIGEAFSDPLFTEHIYGGIYWAATGIIPNDK